MLSTGKTSHILSSSQLDYADITVAFLAMAAICIPFSYLVSYFLDKKRLRRFPFPSVAGFTSLWSWFHNYKMKRFVAIHKAHKSLGPIVRVEPNHRILPSFVR